ncbi:retrovirus-related Pol polyprotein from transposon opus [Trichonephila clavata]|uniref:Retrovirus-related Pol polyprotein from transposon opus n=1 Tax=Trichonephila clavata TaxID=2740835 RepID=A0A8X6IY58_TRICU|nr:retrovirus-related Pol polyprotein from transposon opus [Trichonephila clavata]
MSLADGHKSEVEVYTTSVVIRLEERVIRTQLIILPYAKGNRTLLGMDFLQKAGIVLNLKHRNWFFSDSPHRTYDFVKEAIIQEVQSRPNLEENTCLLRDDEAVNGIWGTACADSGASHSIAGETLYLLLQKEGANFQKTQITMSLADGHKSEVEVYTTSVVIRLEERVIRTQLIILPYAKGNRTLLGMEFLQKAGIV